MLCGVEYLSLTTRVTQNTVTGTAHSVASIPTTELLNALTLLGSAKKMAQVYMASTNKISHTKSWPSCLAPDWADDRLPVNSFSI